MAFGRDCVGNPYDRRKPLRFFFSFILISHIRNSLITNYLHQSYCCWHRGCLIWVNVKSTKRDKNNEEYIKNTSSGFRGGNQLRTIQPECQRLQDRWGYEYGDEYSCCKHTGKHQLRWCGPV